MAVSDADIRETIAELFARRDPDKTICPSEVARALGGDQWRDLMEPVRTVAGELAARGDVVVTQKDQPVDIATARGPVSIGRG